MAGVNAVLLLVSLVSFTMQVYGEFLTNRRREDATLTQRLLLKIDGRWDTTESPDTMTLMNGEEFGEPELPSYGQVKEYRTRAKLPHGIAGLKLVLEYCEIISRDTKTTLIKDGYPTRSSTKVLSADEFSFPATFASNMGGKRELLCNSSLDYHPALRERSRDLQASRSDSNCKGATHGQQIHVRINGTDLKVMCDMVTPDGPWIIVMRNTRQDIFRKSFVEYENGFGNVLGDHFVGLKYLRNVSTQHNASLRIELNDNQYYAVYEHFTLGDSPDYIMQELSGYSGNKHDMTKYQGNPIGQVFFTYDRDLGDCAANGRGGWWFQAYCQTTCLTCDPITYYNREMYDTVTMKVRFDNGVTERANDLVVDGTQAARLHCGYDVMTLTLNSSQTEGLSPHNLQPLKEDCVGFKVKSVKGNITFEIPLLGCGTEVKVKDSRAVFTNSLVYSDNLPAESKRYSQVILTPSCSYPLHGYISTVSY